MQTKQGWSTGTKTLVGCGVGCGVVILAIFFCFLAVAIWVFLPSQWMPAKDFVPQKSSGFISARLDSEDPGIRDLCIQVLKSMEQRRHENMDGSLGTFVEKLQESRARDQMNGISYLMPHEVAVILDERPGTEPAALYLVSLSGAANVARIAMKAVQHSAGSDPQSEIITHEGVKILGTQERDSQQKNYMALHGTTFLFSTDLELLKAALSASARDNSKLMGQSRLAQLYRNASSDHDAVAVFDNSSGWLSDLLQDKEDSTGAQTLEPFADAASFVRYIHGLSIEVNVVDADRIDGTLKLDSGAAAPVAGMTEIISAINKEVSSQAKENGLVYEGKVVQEGNIQVLRFAVKGLREKIQKIPFE